MLYYPTFGNHLLSYHLDIDNSILLEKSISVLNSPLAYSTNIGDENQSFNTMRTATNKRVTTYPYVRTNQEANPHTWDEFNPILDFMHTLPNFERITQSWLGLSLPGGSLGEHVHRTKHSVFIYYVNINESHPQTRFYINNEWVSFNAGPGDCVYFADSILHDVPVNYGSGDRIVISADI